MLTVPFEDIIRDLCERVLSTSSKKLPAAIIEHVQKTFPVEVATLWLTEQGPLANSQCASRPQIRIVASTGKFQTSACEIGQGLIGRIAESRKSLIINGRKKIEEHRSCRTDDRRSRPGYDFVSESCRSFLGVPLILTSEPLSDSGLSEQSVVGVLSLENKYDRTTRDTARFRNQDLPLVKSYGAVIAMALGKAQLQVDSTRIGSQLLATSNLLLEKHGEQPDLMKFAEFTANAIAAEACAIWLREGLELRLRGASGYPGITNLDSIEKVPSYKLADAWKAKEALPKSEPLYKDEKRQKIGLTVFVAIHPETINLKSPEEVRSHPAWKGANDVGMWNREQGLACSSLLAIPLVDRETGEVKGIFKIENKRPTHYQLHPHFSEVDCELLTTLGNSLTLSLIIAERLDLLKRLENLVSKVRIHSSEEEALFYILTGMTHNQGLQYNRAMVFLRSPEGDFKCQYAVGQVESHDWQAAMKGEDGVRSLDATLNLYAENPLRYRPNDMFKRWHGLSIRGEESHLLARFVRDYPVREHPEKSLRYNKNDVKKGDPLEGFALGDFVVVPIRVNQKLVGIIYGDNRFTGNNINAFELEVLDLFGGMAAAIIEASRVPKRIEDKKNETWREISGPAAHRLGTETFVMRDKVRQLREGILQAQATDETAWSKRRVTFDKLLEGVEYCLTRFQLAAVEYNSFSYEPEADQSFDLLELLNEIKNESTMRLKVVEVSVINNAPIKVFGCKSQLKRAFEELVMNSYKEVAEEFRPPGGKNDREGRHSSIRVRFSFQRDGGRVIILVQDDGPGIPKDIIDELFVKRHVSRRFGGTGLGCYLIARTLKTHCETTTVRALADHRSEDYPGACIRIDMPLRSSSSRKASQAH